MTTPDQRIAEIFGGLGGGRRKPPKKKTSTWARLVAVGAIGGAGVLAYDYAEQHARSAYAPPPVRAPLATPDQNRACLNALVSPKGASAYESAVQRYAYRGGADYVNCVAESVCGRLRDNPVSYFVYRLGQPNTCRRLTGLCGHIADAVDPADAAACAFDPTERLAVDQCLDRLDARDRDAMQCAFDPACGEQTYAARYGVSPATMRQQLSRARARLGRCLGETGD